MSNGGIGQYNIYVGAVGATERAIGASGAKDGLAAWSPAANEIAFVSSRTGHGDLYLAELGSQRLTQLTSAPAVDLFPEWFPDGERLVYATGDALDHDLAVLERRDGRWSKPAPLTAWARDDLRPTVSPDGKLVAFYADAGGEDPASRRWNIHVVPYVPGKTYREAELARMVVAEDVVIDLNTGPSWSPDSSKLFYVKRDQVAANPIYAYDLYTGRQYTFETGTRMNRDILVSRLGVLSFRAQVGVWDRVFVGLTNQGAQLQTGARLHSSIHYVRLHAAKEEAR
jgi:Tol biopolymer transport system component